MNNKKDDYKASLAMGGGTLLGLGVGFFLLEQSPLFFVGSIFVGLGLGLMISSFVSTKK